jgi:hypothetical protein
MLAIMHMQMMPNSNCSQRFAGGGTGVVEDWVMDVSPVYARFSEHFVQLRLKIDLCINQNIGSICNEPTRTHGQRCNISIVPTEPSG